VVRTDLATTPSTALVRLFALYTGIVALALLVFAYISMTRLVVEPIDRLSRAARRVAEGARRLEAPRGGALELVELGTSLTQMTAKLLAEEEALRAKIAEVERYAEDLARAQERLVRSERLASVGRLAAGLAHEIGNPIAAILGFEELLLQGGLDEADQRDFLVRMKRETERIHRILRDLLDFARPAVQRRPGEPEAAGDVRTRAANTSLPPVGTVLQNKNARTGETRAECRIVEGGVEYKGQLYKSLSAAAIAASRDLGNTTKQTSGPKFWGLVDKGEFTSRTPLVKALDFEALDAAWTRYRDRMAGALQSASDDDKAKLREALLAHAEAIFDLAQPEQASAAATTTETEAA